MKTNLIKGLFILIVAAFVIGAAVFIWNGSMPGTDLPSKDKATLPGLLLAELSSGDSDMGANPPSQAVTAALNPADMSSADPAAAQPICEGPEQMILLATGRGRKRPDRCDPPGAPGLC